MSNSKIFLVDLIDLVDLVKMNDYLRNVIGGLLNVYLLYQWVLSLLITFAARDINIKEK